MAPNPMPPLLIIQQISHHRTDGGQAYNRESLLKFRTTSLFIYQVLWEKPWVVESQKVLKLTLDLKAFLDRKEQLI